MPIDRLRLDPSRAPWEQQPGESNLKYGQFITYRDLGRGRTIQKASERLAKTSSYLRAVAAANLWRARAEEYDREQDRVYQAEWAATVRKSAESRMKVLDAMLGKGVQRLMSIDVSKMGPGELARWLDTAMRHMHLLAGSPMQTIALTGPGGGPIRVEADVNDGLAGLPLEQKAARMLEMSETIRRRARAIQGQDDEDDEDA